MEKNRQSLESFSLMDSYEYGHPACEIIEREMGVWPSSCEEEKSPSSVRQTRLDREQNYDLDGVSMSGSGVLVASAKGERSD